MLTVEQEGHRSAIDAMQSSAQVDSADIDTKLDEAYSQITSMTEEAASLRHQLAATVPAADMETLKTKLESAKRSNGKLRAEVNDQRAAVDAADCELADVQARAEEARKTEKKRLQKVEKKLQYEQARNEKLAKECDAYKKSIAELTAATEYADANQKKVVELNGTLQQVVQELEDADATIGELRQAKARLLHENETLERHRQESDMRGLAAEELSHLDPDHPWGSSQFSWIGREVERVSLAACAPTRPPRGILM